MGTHDSNNNNKRWPIARPARTLLVLSVGILVASPALGASLASMPEDGVPTEFVSAVELVIDGTTRKAGPVSAGLLPAENESISQIAIDPHGGQVQRSSAQTFAQDLSLSITVEQQTSPVPEPAAIMIYGAGLVGIGFLIRRLHRR